MYFHKRQGQALIFVQANDQKLSLKEFASQVFEDLTISRWDGIYSQQSPDVTSYTGNALNIEVAVGSRDEDEYPFIVALHPKIAFGDTDYLVEHARNIAKYWANRGWRCFVPREGLYEIANFQDGYTFTPPSISI